MKIRAMRAEPYQVNAYHFEDFTWYGDGWEGEAVVVCYYGAASSFNSPSDSYRIWYL